jgi:Tol biopolymer transport system component
MVRVLLFLICLLSSGCVFAEDPGIQCMVVGDQVLEVQENRQLTHYSDGKVSDVCISPDGRYVIYRVADDSPGGRIKAAIVKASGGRSTVVMDGPGSEPDEGELAQRDGVWVPGVWRLDHGANPWSPDGSLVAFPAVHVVMDQNGGREECWIVVKNNTGVQRTAFQLANGVRVMETPIFWSPDGRKLAVVEQPEIEVGQAGKTLRICLLVLDIFKGTVQMVPCGSQPPDLLGWTRDGKSLLYSVQAGDRTELREATVEGGAVRVITDKYRPQGLSPNGAWRVVNDDEGIKLEEVSSGDKTNVTGNVRAEFIGWAPNGRMFLYRRPETIRDNTAERHTDLRTLWMS